MAMRWSKSGAASAAASTGRAAAVPLELPEGVRGVVVAACREAFPLEACGILLGTETSQGRRVSRAVPVKNDAPAEQQARRYCVPSATLLAVEREAESRGERVLGFYHSHPNHAPQPSPTDLTEAWPYYSYLIVSIREGGAFELRSWRLDEQHGRFQPEPLSIVPDASQAARPAD